MALGDHVATAMVEEMKPDLPAVPGTNNALKRIRGIEDELFAQAMEVTTRAMQFGDIGWGSEAPPEEWIEEMGSEEAAWRRFRYTKAGQLPQAAAPAGLKIAMACTMGMMRSREGRSGPQLNVAIVQLSQQPVASYPVQDIENE